MKGRVRERANATSHAYTKTQQMQMLQVLKGIKVPKDGHMMYSMLSPDMSPSSYQPNQILLLSFPALS